ncbi:hypothetical protein ALP94_101156 [Pseudomonas savastanoi pv. glycinea]|uniref:Uncharacterized protein n=2 Tax=Pseudomonas syringae group TaxID=136849 RepID=A0AB74AXN7_PSESG|nr:hypothetical protein ALQ67_103882 [Pseudomonas savastanoi pv. glycinea]RMN22888.1 hypothetical protein ALQ64_102739 [Pseudomonas cannabina]RMQ09436.1 hypothetical protein ALQ11_103105 [Pseudomonas savastanoi pv. glycinea]RMQ22016.1 hypothetical protein ALQ10_103096 [Pseudomonas savastanoi pv. glycinea]RMQ93580.1 hypothetical protein ALP95_103570 [Pseudomonas savastanoi pv. glycinea]
MWKRYRKVAFNPFFGVGDGLKKLFADIDATLASRRGDLFRRITLYRNY